MDLARELKMLYNIWMTAILIVAGALRTDPKAW